jgi:3-phenylpropionate/cinnamic acid dioxygenase small subunit
MAGFDAEDLRQILGLLAEYGASVDEQRWEDHLDVWTEDAELAVFGRSRRGHAAIERFMRRSIPGKHVTAAPHLEFDGDRARSTADFVFYRASDLQLYGAGVYRDDLVRSSGIWKIARREIDMQLRTSS